MKYKMVKLSDICDLIAGFAFKSKDFGDFEDKVIKIADIVPPRVEMKSLRGVDLSNYNKEKLKKFIAEPGDYVLAMTGATIGKIGRIHDKSAYINQRVLLFRPHKEIDKDFLYYTICARSFYDYIISFVDSETAQPNISATTVGKYELNLPEIKTQRKIAAFLKLFDDKIELNNKINENLQQQALCLYSHLTDGKPKNGYIGDYCTIKSGYAFKSKWWQNIGVPVVKIGSINQDYLDLSGCSFVSADKMPIGKDYTVTGGDILIAMTGATIGKFALVPKINRPVLVNQRVGKFFLGDNPVKKVPFIYCTLKQPEITLEIANRGQGSAQPNISASDIMYIPCVLPPREDINKFNRENSPMFETIINNQFENFMLAKARALLLPKVLSGKIDVSEIDL